MEDVRKGSKIVLKVNWSGIAAGEIGTAIEPCGCAVLGWNVQFGTRIIELKKPRFGTVWALAEPSSIPELVV